MKNLEQIKEILKGQKEILRQNYGVSIMGIFGSCVRGEMANDSDLDILVELDKSIGLLKFVNLENYLSDILKLKVDLVMRDALKPRIRRHILKEVIYL
jgi:predicted nucleotidyltransferase